MNRILVIIVGVVLMSSGCATSGTNAEDPYFSAQARPQTQQQTQQLHADLVREMIAQGRYYAALAHIEEIEKAQGPGDELRLLKAQVLAKLGRRQEAEQTYTSLLHGAFEGEARHGLGLLYADSNYPLSLQYLQVAANLRPTNAEIRNDLGYALLMGGYYPEGRLQLATAYELDAARDKNRNNYVLSLLLVKDEAAVQRLVRAGVVTTQAVVALRKKAKDWPQIVQRTHSAVPRNPATAPNDQTSPVAAKAATASARQRDDEKTVKERLRLGATP